MKLHQNDRLVVLFWEFLTEILPLLSLLPVVAYDFVCSFFYDNGI